MTAGDHLGCQTVQILSAQQQENRTSFTEKSGSCPKTLNDLTFYFLLPGARASSALPTQREAFVRLLGEISEARARYFQPTLALALARDLALGEKVFSFDPQWCCRENSCWPQCKCPGPNPGEFLLLYCERLGDVGTGGWFSHKLRGCPLWAASQCGEHRLTNGSLVLPEEAFANPAQAAQLLL